MKDTFVMTQYEGQIERITHEMRVVLALLRVTSAIWRVLTLGRGYTWLPVAIPLAFIYGFVLWIGEPLWKFSDIHQFQQWRSMLRWLKARTSDACASQRRGWLVSYRLIRS